MDKILNSSHLKRLIILYNNISEFEYIYSHVYQSVLHSTVTALARFRGLSTSVPFSKAT